MFTFNKIRLIMIHVLKVFFHTTDTRIDSMFNFKRAIPEFEQ